MTRAILWAFLGIGLVPTSAYAEHPLVIVLAPPSQPTPSYLDALRIQVRGVATIDVEPHVDSVALASRVAHASRVLSRRGAALVVWADTVMGEQSRDPIVYAVGKNDRRAVMEVVELHEPQSPEQDRVVALKIAALLDDVLHRASLRDVVPPFSDLTFQASKRRLAWGGEARVGAFLGTGSGSVGGQAGIQLAAGPGLRTRRFEAELAMTVGLLSNQHNQSPAGQIDTSQWTLGLAAGGRYRWDRFSLGPSIGASFRVVSATGQTVDGRMGDAVRWVPTGRLGLEVRYRFWDRLSLRANLGAEMAFERQRFSLVGQPAVDLGRIRGVAELDVVIFLP